ncbi:MAG: transposase [Usitatibacter sp.]
MPRTSRLRLAEVPVHVVQRGHNRAPCFVDSSDYDRYLCLVAELSKESNCQVHSYVLMPNHVHLLLTPGHVESASTFMQGVNQRYVQYVNRKRKRTGSLWEGRFRSSLVDSENYFFICQRYIEMNPVRAALVDFPGQYRWSSYRANAEAALSEIVCPHQLFIALGSSEGERRKNYRALFQEPLSAMKLERIRHATRLGRPLGGEVFVSVMAGLFGDRAAPRPPGRPRKDDVAGPGEIPV